jgi:hypothetical protein
MPLTKDPNTPPHHGSRQGALIGLQIFFILVALLVYGLRVYTRRFILRSLGNDDYIMGIAVVRLLLSADSFFRRYSFLPSLLQVDTDCTILFLHTLLGFSKLIPFHLSTIRSLCPAHSLPLSLLILS